MQPAGCPHGGFPHNKHHQKQDHQDPVKPVGHIREEMIIDTADLNDNEQTDKDPVDLFDGIGGILHG